MSNDKSDRGFMDGILGGLTVSLFNHFFQQKDKTLVDWDDIDYFESFSYAELRKRQGYKLKYDIDESKIIPKTVNLLQLNKYSYKLIITNERLKDSIKNTNPETCWDSMASSFSYMLNDILNEGIVILENTMPKYWVYGIEESDDFVKIIISDGELMDDIYEDIDNSHKTQFCDEYYCMNLTEARGLAKEMKRYYHNYVERVLILEELEQTMVIDDKYYKDMILNTIPSYYKILDMINKTNNSKYNEISKLLYDIHYQVPRHIIYAVYSLGIQLYKDEHYQYSRIVFEDILKVDDIVLNESGFKNITRRNLLEIYIKFKDEREIIEILKYNFEDDFDIFQRARSLYELKLFEAAKVAYNIFTNKANVLQYGRYFFEAFLRTENEEGIKDLREQLINEKKDTFLIDRYLNNMDPEGLAIKIEGYVNSEKWEQVIIYSNKYVRLLVDNHWGKMDDILDFELKNINAYMQLDKLKEAWFASCKARRTLIANFNGPSYFEYLSKVENYMADICFKRGYLIDTAYHYIFKIIYNDLFKLYYNPNNSLPQWDKDLDLEDIIEKGNLKEWWLDIEPLIINEYKALSGKSPRNINLLMLSSLDRFNHKIQLKEPKKYFPTTIATDFHIK